MSRWIKPVLAVLMMLIAGCSGTEESEMRAPSKDGKPRVHTTSYPLRYFVERIASPVVDVEFLAEGDGDPAYWKPSADDVLAMQQADLVVLNGASYETWLQNVSLPPSRTLVTTAGLRDRLIPTELATTHSHGPEGEHEHAGTAFTTWLDPALAAAQAAAIEEALSTRWPEHAQQFDGRLAELVGELDALDAELQQVVAGNPGVPVLFSHPVYQYLERRYRIHGHSVHWEPGVMPGEAAWNELATLLEHAPTRWMIWEGEPLQPTVRRLESMGIRSIVFDPCGNRPPSGDFMSTMRQNLENLRLVFAERP